MVPQDFAALSARRVARARALAERSDSTREALEFIAEVAELQADVVTQTTEWSALAPLLERVSRLVSVKGTDVLKATAQQLDEASFQQALRDYWERRDTASVQSVFARIVLQPYAATAKVEVGVPGDGRCPRCGHRPQVGLLHPEGDGSRLTLSCSLCLSEWPFQRGRCPSCGEQDEKKLVYYSAEEYGAIKVGACETCHGYIHTIDLSQEPQAVADVDEVTALPLDVWAHERGYEKIQPNLVGI